jgi:putative heme-binding domain-containing protein
MIEAGTLNGSAEVAELINRFKQQQSDGGLLSQHLVSLEGGDAERGRSLFVGHRVAQCVRCHKAGTLIPGGNAGPDLAQVARRHPRLALLQSLVEPSVLIARGFESVTLVLDSGNIVAGVIRTGESLPSKRKRSKNERRPDPPCRKCIARSRRVRCEIWSSSCRHCNSGMCDLQQRR